MTTTQRVIVSLLAGVLVFILQGIFFGKAVAIWSSLAIIITAAITRRFRIEKKE